MSRLAQAWKAVLAFLLPGLIILGDTLQAGEDVTGRVVLLALITSAVTSGAVYGVRNASPPGRHRAGDQQPNGGFYVRDDGWSAVELLVVVILVVILLLLLGLLPR